jgi:methylation protein EvaC
MPIANGFLAREDFAREQFWNLTVGVCAECGLCQLVDRVPRERLFHDRYPFFSSSSRGMRDHFRALAQSICGRLARPSPFIVEIGSNDGTLLRHLAAACARPLGVEPSANVAKAAAAKGLDTVVRFFDSDCARDIVARNGQADAVVGTNVFSHIPAIRDLFEACGTLLTEDGIIVGEDPYLGDIVEQVAFDQFYDEHVFYFSAAAIARLAASTGFEIVDVERHPVHGGSIAYVLGRVGVHLVTRRAADFLDRETALGLADPSTFERLRGSVERAREDLISLLRSLRPRHTIAGYAATSKSTTTLNYTGIGPDVLDFIADSTRMKQGLFSPGMHVPIRPPDVFRAHPPDYAVLFGWNHQKEILANESAFAAHGGRWIRYVPDLSIGSSAADGSVEWCPVGEFTARR